MCLAPFHIITKYIKNLHLFTILLTLIQIKINEKGYILTRTTVSILNNNNNKKDEKKLKTSCKLY